MKKIVCYIGSMQYGGANRVMANLANYFATNGMEVVLINDIRPRNDKPEYKVLQSVKRLYLENSCGVSLLKNLIMIHDLRKIIKEEKPDTVISFMGPPNYRMLLSTIGLRTRKIVSVRNDPYMEYGKGLKKFIVKLVFEMADACVFQTEDASKYFSKSLKRRSKIIYNPVRESFFEVETKREKKNIVSVGRFEKQKNHRLMIDAFRIVAELFPEEKLVLYGEGSLKEELINHVDNLGLKGRVLFPGNTSNVEEKLGESKVFVLSSDYEGMPNALMEAMAVGLPVISTDCPCGGPKTLISSSNEGILVECGNAKQMSESMKKLLEDSDLRDELSKNARERALDFMPCKVYAQWEKIV